MNNYVVPKAGEGPSPECVIDIYTSPLAFDANLSHARLCVAVPPESLIQASSLLPTSPPRLHRDYLAGLSLCEPSSKAMVTQVIYLELVRSLFP